MGFAGIQQNELICIKVPIVYDWIVSQSRLPSQIFRGTAGLERLNFTCEGIAGQFQEDQLSVECILTNAEGNPIDPLMEGSISCTESPRGRENVEAVLPDGQIANLQKVRLTNRGYFVIRLENTNGDICVSSPQRFTLCEEFLLCAPSGTTLKCEIIDFDCNSCFNCVLDEEGNPSFQEAVIDLTICKSIQLESLVTIEVDASVCRQRQQIETECPSKDIPSSCFPIFPVGE
ncbi:hypothetical protein [Sediminibacillus massiliensis]|uniref:hypothetical protein n=1 Tax=Sediminibacillus massiliensis TaxID=1926277 RepID=UPI00098891C3|nr:hypothetical protein [Sediminibacillus massiliensis]